jgi:hypothetical protein
MIHFLEQNAMLTIESSAVLFEMIGFEENVPNFPFLAMWCVMVKTQSASVFSQMTQNNDVQ